MWTIILTSQELSEYQLSALNLVNAYNKTMQVQKQSPQYANEFRVSNITQSIL